MEPKREEMKAAAYLHCFLCEQRCLQPRMCPRCTKVFCSNCLLPFTSALRPDCPACAARLKPEDFLGPRILMTIAQQIVQNVKREAVPGEDRQVCPQHNLSMNYFCLDCDETLCSDCGMISFKHKGHRFLAYRDIYEQVKARVMEQFPRFDRKIECLSNRKNTLKTSLAQLQSDYRRFKKYFEQSFLTHTQKVQKEGKRLQDKLLAKEEANTRRHHQLEVLRESIFDQMETKTQISLIRQASSLAQSIEALACHQPLPASGQPLPDLEELTELTPQFTTWRYTLTNFSTRSGIVYSEPQNMNGVEWRLKVYPNGNGLARDKYISVFVEMTKGLVNENKYDYRIELLNPLHPELSVKREYCSSFQIGECWGYNQFQPLDQLAAKQYIQEDALTFQIGIRNHTYRSLVIEKALYIEYLKSKIEERQQKNRIRFGENIREGISEGGSIVERSQTLERIKEYLLESKRSCEW